MNAVAFSRDGTILASGDGDGAVRLWDVATRGPIGGPLTGHAGSVNAVAFSRDGGPGQRRHDGTVRLSDMATRGQFGGPLTGHTGAVVSVALSPDGRTVASGGQDGTVRLRDQATRGPIGDPLTGHTNVVLSVAFSPDGADAGQRRRRWHRAAVECGQPFRYRPPPRRHPHDLDSVRPGRQDPGQRRSG